MSDLNAFMEVTNGYWHKMEEHKAQREAVWAHQNGYERGTVTVSLFDQEKYYGGWPPENLLEYATWLQGLIAVIPDEFKSVATIEVDSRGSYEGTHYATICIEYRRPETDQEYSERVEKQKAIMQRVLAEHEKAERSKLEELKAKYAPVESPSKDS